MSFQISKTEKKMLEKITKACKGRPAQIHRDAKGKYYVADGREITGAGLWGLIDKGILAPCEDGLFPGHTQTFRVDAANFAARS